MVLKLKICFTALALFLVNLCIDAQDYSQLVSMNYAGGQTLNTVLTDINQQYGVDFAYSNNMIAVNKPIRFAAYQVTLDDALNQLFKENDIVHAKIGHQVVLKPSKNKPVVEFRLLSSNDIPKAIDAPISNKNTDEQERLVKLIQKSRDQYKDLPKIHHRTTKSLPGGNRIVVFDQARIEALSKKIVLEEKEEKPETGKRLAQLSLLPYVGTNALKSNELTNNFSVNVLFGTNGGLDGLEVGGLTNHIKNDASGVQVAGLGNTIGGKLIGTQVSGLFNVVGGKVEGVQVSGLFNLAKEATAVQAAGLFNVASKSFTGIQASAIFNYAGEGSGVQVAPMFNINRGRVSTQISGFFNVGGDVEQLQISPFLNVGKKVSGFQIGLINVADTIAGAPIGILNLVKKGYNKVEIGSGETLLGNVSLKLGVRAFYNIFHVGARWDKLIDADDNVTREVSWGVGYGIGTAFQLNSKLLLNVEGVATHINEAEEWTDELNLLTQFKLLFDVRISRGINVFFGPSYNMMFSRLIDPETGVVGSNIMPYTFYDQTEGITNTKMWVGFNGGLRF